MELLKTINGEFGIPSSADNARDLMNTLNTFLMEKKSQNKDAILLVDEAQNLSKDVLEQLRLLSNLETNTSKLLQIILVGQPELRDMLDSYELRQLRQRMTLSWYLTPLNRSETREYIRHRVSIATRKTDDIFSESAYRSIYKYSGGIPRLINILCDRALLTAFGLNTRKVTGSIARSAIRELNARGGDVRHLFTKPVLLTGFILLVGLASIGIFLFKGPLAPGPAAGETGENPAVKTVSLEKPAQKPAPVTTPADSFEDFLGGLTNRSSRYMAVKAAILLWQETPRLNRYLNNIDENREFFRIAATQNNFQVLTVEKDLELITKLNLPAVLEFLPPGAISPRYLTLIKMSGNEILFRGGEKDEIIRTTPAEMNSFWSGNAYILWKDFLNYKGNIPLDAPDESVFTLKMLLRDIGFTDIPLDRTYDDVTRAVIKQIQEKHGIEVDGIVGARTKIVIYNEKKELSIPRIIN
jgi:general secretion pathway protein A